MNHYLNALKKYVDFKGRARRSEFWIFTLTNQLILIILSLVFRFSELMIVVNIFALATFIPTLSAGIRRMHDTGKNGWFFIVPLYGMILAITEGDAGENAYGKDPKANSHDS